jgi:hypothetical protein
LNLPPITNEQKISDGKHFIFDTIRKQWLVLTPEEWVRQHILGYLIHYKNYPASLIKTEAPNLFNGKSKRSDIVCYNTQLEATILIECKASSVAITQKTLSQLASYQSTFNAPILGLSNGLEHYFFSMSSNGIESMDDLPSYTI